MHGESLDTGDHFAAGTRVGDYTIEGECSVEDAVVVYVATHLVLPRKVTLKVLRGGPSGDRRVAVQMLREACLLEALTHTGIPRVFECGVLADRRPWAAFERAGGTSLAASLSHGSLGLAELVVVLRDVADVLVHAHARGVVHGRLAAETIFRTPDRQHGVCLRGWGGARTVAADALELRDDVYALGEIAFRVLTGCLHTTNVSATDWCPSAPAELTALIDVMLDSSASVRPTSEEVRERARWLATTVEPLVIDKPRWTPPNGLDADTLEPMPMADSGKFSIRIGGGRSR